MRTSYEGLDGKPTRKGNEESKQETTQQSLNDKHTSTGEKEDQPKLGQNSSASRLADEGTAATPKGL